MIGTVLYPLLYVLIGTLIFVAIAFVIGQFRYGKHRGVSREEFVRTFTDRGVPSEIPSAVYDLYKSRVINKEFSVAPDDEYSTLSAGEDEIYDDAEFLLEKLNLKPPSKELQLQWIQLIIASRRAEAAPGFGVDSSSILTLSDMVLWLDWVRQHQPANHETLSLP